MKKHLKTEIYDFCQRLSVTIGVSWEIYSLVVFSLHSRRLKRGKNKGTKLF